MPAFSSMQEPLTLYKLMILYLISSAKNPLGKTQISDCLIELNFTDYLTVQTAIGELLESGFLSAADEDNTVLLSLTDDGSRALSLFMGSLSEGIRKDLNDYLSSHHQELSHARDLSSNYRRSTNGEYEVNLSAKDRGNNLLRITMNVPSEEIAANVCNNWAKESAEIYEHLTKKLF